jgi:hypothetical protein
MIKFYLLKLPKKTPQLAIVYLNFTIWRQILFKTKSDNIFQLDDALYSRLAKLELTAAIFNIFDDPPH